MTRDIFAIFRRDGRELLRDRRTLFVNLVLPVLLYPLLVLFILQVAQLNAARPAEVPVVLAVDLPSGLLAPLQDLPASTAKPEAAMTKAMSAAQEGVAVREVAADAAGGWRAHGAALAESSPTPTQRAAACAALRAAGAVAALVLLPAEGTATPRLIMIADDASPRYDAARTTCERAAKSWRRGLSEASLKAAGLPTSVLDPVQVVFASTAPMAEAVRTRIAGAVPMLLVLMAVIGAFWPAVDLMAGERERGTLETLLVSPIRRRDIFLGKLLVVCCAGLASVVLNLLSLGVTTGLLASQLGGAGFDLGNLVAQGAGALALCAIALIPVVVALAAASLALAGFAHSAKEAQNYLAPLVIAVQMAAVPALMPQSGPSWALDLVPVTGSVLALKEALQAPRIPWGHLALSTAASVSLAVVLVAWASRLMDEERFRYPGLVRAGWGRFRRWGEKPAAPTGVEVLGLFAIAVAGVSMLGKPLMAAGPVAMVVGPLLLFIALPALLLAWLGDYQRKALFLVAPRPGQAIGALLMVPAAIGLSLSLGLLQGLIASPSELKGVEAQIQAIIRNLTTMGGLPLVLLCLAFAPAICEEVLCRSLLLAGFRRSLGPVWAVALTAFLFAALHMSPWRFAPQMALGVLLAVLTLRSGSLVPAILVHAGHNGLMVAAAVLADQEPWKGYQPWLVQHINVVAASGALVAILAASWGWRLISQPKASAPV